MNFFEDLVNHAASGVFIIAEACDNHMGSLDIAKSLVRAAKDAGTDAVKFQHHLVEFEMVRNEHSSDNFAEPLHDFLDRNALSLEDHKDLKSYCDSVGITYLCTPFSINAAREIKDLVPFFKIGSGEFQDYWYIDQLIQLKKPVLLSTGMCTDSEISEWLDRYKNTDLDYALMNCLSEYPPKYEHLNLNFVTEMNELCGGMVGHSDHTPTIGSSLVAIAFGAQIIEKHMTLSHLVDGPDSSVSLDPSEFKLLVDEARLVKPSLGNSKKVQSSEKAVRNWAYRSIVTTGLVKEGQVIAPEDICSKRPGTGIESKNYKDVIGKKATRDIATNTILEWEDLK